MDPQIQRRRTLDAIKRILLRESLNQPLIVIFEDLHWIDDETQALLNLLVDAIGTARILMLVNYRPEYRHRVEQQDLSTRSSGSIRSARRAPRRCWRRCSAMARNSRRSSGSSSSGPRAIRSSWKRRCRCCSMRARWCATAAVQLTQPLSELKIPPTVQAILASRIDRLSSGTKDLLQTLAVIGREFPFR